MPCRPISVSCLINRRMLLWMCSKCLLTAEYFNRYVSNIYLSISLPQQKNTFPLTSSTIFNTLAPVIIFQAKSKTTRCASFLPPRSRAHTRNLEARGDGLQEREGEKRQARATLAGAINFNLVERGHARKRHSPRQKKRDAPAVFEW